MNNMPLQDTNNSGDWMDDYEGQLAVDAYQTADEIIIRAPIAGVRREDLEITITDEVINIKGERKMTEEVAAENVLAQECYWGSFARSYVLPIPVSSEKATAVLRDGLLTIRIPKLEKTKTKTIEIKTE